MLAPAAGASGEEVVVGGRSATLHVPPGYDGSRDVPLVVGLHTYGGTGATVEAALRLTPLADELGFLVLIPEGTQHSCPEAPFRFPVRFWNATEACCDFCNSKVDDSGYIRALIEETQAAYAVDPARIFVVGLSNGGFMSHRLACDHPDLIAAIVSISGATVLNELDCGATEPVHVLQIHGDRDDVVCFGGTSSPFEACPGGFEGIFPTAYPAAAEGVEQWARRNRCSATPDLSPPPRDLEASLSGDESAVTRYEAGCAPSGSAELWTVVGGGHQLSFSTDFGRHVAGYLLAHPKAQATPPPTFRAFALDDPGDLDGSGTLVEANNLGAAVSVEAGGISFGSDATSAAFGSGGPFAQNSLRDPDLNLLMSSLVWTNAPGIGTLRVGDLAVGKRYRLQYLAIAGSFDGVTPNAGRTLRVTAEGESFDLAIPGSVTEGRILAFEWTAGGTTLHLSVEGIAGVDQNPFLNAYAVHEIPSAPALGWEGRVALALLVAALVSVARLRRRSASRPARSIS